MYVLFTEDGIPGWIGPSPVEGSEYVGDMEIEFLAAHRRTSDGVWVPRDPPAPPSDDKLAAMEAERAAVMEAERAAAIELAIDDAIQSSPEYRSFIRGGMTLTAYRDAASSIAAMVRAAHTS